MTPKESSSGAHGSMDIEEKGDKKSFTIRIESDILTKLNDAANKMGIKSATIARNYLKLADSVFIQPNMDMMSFDNSALMIIPNESFHYIISLLLDNSKEVYVKQVDTGDRLGDMLNKNAECMGMEDPVQKIELAQSWGWFKSALIDNYVAIPRSFGPVTLVNAMVYRIATKRRYPYAGNWNWRDFFVDDGTLNQRYPKKENKGELQNIQNQRDSQRRDLGAVESNWDEGTAYYKYEVLKKKK
jgi:hypothetical protein